MRIPITAFLLSLAMACGSDEPPQESSDAQSRRARDSAIAESGLPGAAGVRRALTASDTADARRTLVDSLAREAN